MNPPAGYSGLGKSPPRQVWEQMFGRIAHPVRVDAAGVQTVVPRVGRRRGAGRQQSGSVTTGESARNGGGSCPPILPWTATDLVFLTRLPGPQHHAVPC